jgi:hypothetical protein
MVGACTPLRSLPPPVTYWPSEWAIGLLGHPVF